MSKYQPLSDRLAGHPADAWSASFDEVETVLGFPLPKAARKSRSWWSGPDKPHTRAWMTSGWEVGDVDPAAGKVTFRRPVSEAAMQAAPPTPELAPADSAPEQASPRARAKGWGMAALIAAGAAVATGAAVAIGMKRRGSDASA